MTLKTPQDQQAVNARPTPQWDFAPEGALASSPQVGLGGAGGRALLSSILNAYVQKKETRRKAWREQAVQRAAQARAYSGEGRRSEEWGLAFFGSAPH